MIAPEERLAAALARLILDPTAPPARHIAVGAASPIPAAACWLVKQLGHPVRLSLLHRPRGNPFSEGTRELFDMAGQGRIDLFFLGGGQIDGHANINLLGTGDWPGRTARFPGSVLVPQVDMISAPGVSAPGVYRRGTAQALVTGRCVFRFDPKGEGRFRLDTIHPGETADSVRANTGFDYDDPGAGPTPDPTDTELTLLRGPVQAEMRETYPDFCARVWQAAA